ncbi:MAG: tRNA pseudouridine(38-40) synthase TruA [Acidimicrobiia bacterium]
MPTYRVDLAYDGSRFHGYAIQPGLRTVQGDLEAVLFHHTGGATTHVAGRTDKGVHATDQVVSFSCDTLDVARVVRSVNRQLAPEIAVRRITEVADDFHARFSATGRAYRYRIQNSGIHDPFESSVTWTFAPQLDVELMDEVAQVLVGEHDFAAFCRSYEDVATTRYLDWAAWRRNEDIVELSIGGSSFCHQLVRSVVAMCVEIGRGRVAPDEMQIVLESKDRTIAKGAAPPQGLTLVAVAYGEPLPRPSWIPDTE